MKQVITALALASIIMLSACEGSHEKAGEKADAAMNASGGLLHDGPQERLGKLQDRDVRDQAKATEAQADAVEDRAHEIKTAAGQQADVLEAQAKKIREQAKTQAKALDQQANAIRGK